MITEIPQNEFIKKAELNDTTELELEILKDPSKFDAEKLRKEFVKKLDAVRGGKMLTSPMLLKKYDEALKKIDENIAKLTETRDYSSMKIKVLDAKHRYETFKPENGNYVHLVIMQFDLDDLRSLKKKDSNIKKESVSLLTYTDRRVLLNNVADLEVKIVGKLDEYYKKTIPEMNKADMIRLTSASAGEASIVDYDNLNFSLSEERIMREDIAKYTSDEARPGIMSSLEKQFDKMKKVAALSFPKLSKSDQFVMKNLNSAISASRKKEKNADVWFRGALELSAMTLAKSKAQQLKKEAVEYGSTNDLLESGNKLFSRANEIATKSYQIAEKLYKEAGDKYFLAAELLARAGKKKIPLDGSVDKKLASK